MKLSKFNFDLPPSLISKYPSKNRDESKLLVVNRETETFEHKQFKDIIDYFDSDDALIVNNTRVFPARLFGRKEKTGAKIEVFLLRELNEEMRLWDVLVDPARKIRVGNKLYFGEDDILIAEVFDNTTSRGRTIRFLYDGDDDEYRKLLSSLGETPLPKYIKREPESIDKERYQTIYAKYEGAVAAPTAGLHFTDELIKRMKVKGIDFAEVTLHVGLGTFRAIEVEDLSKHKMDAEYYKIPPESAKIVNKAKTGKKRICSVGTTSMRTIETAVSATGMLTEAEGWTNLFIHPPFEFKIANAMITNFHTPKSSLLIMAAAFGGYDLIMAAYKEAIKQKYQFFTYGDAMLIL